MKEEFKFTPEVVLVPTGLVFVLWVIFWLEIRFGFNLNFLGIYPLQLKGIPGIFTSPFIHSSIAHLYSNTLPIFILSAALFYFYKPIAWNILFYGILVTGILTWLIGRPAYHIGASGLIYVLFSFIFFKGIVTKHFRLIALSLVVVFIYGSLIWNVLPLKEETSWEGHLSGFLVGLAFAFLFKDKLPKPKKYEWEEENYKEEEDEFLQHFDGDGNFIAHKPYLEEE